ncbi:Hypothetical predicted protein [Prunus dulcis]|uniref:Uncharacterized protein n=1 Tax=Prunus dulcis TaxID=3755 RepID=A0A5E4F0Z3_PRUDU|nr:Hypothetical predicted protein [Prunus dulcis]
MNQFPNPPKAPRKPHHKKCPTAKCKLDFGEPMYSTEVPNDKIKENVPHDRMKEKVSAESLSRSSSMNSVAAVREEMLKISLPMLFKKDGSRIIAAISHQPPQSLINQSTPLKNGESEILDVVSYTNSECFGIACNQNGRTEFFSKKESDVLRIKPLASQYGCRKTLEYGSRMSMN